MLVYGKYEVLDRDNPDVYAYTRDLNGKTFLVLLNFKSTVSTPHTGINIAKAKLVLGNYSVPSTDGQLKPYEAVIFEL